MLLGVCVRHKQAEGKQETHQDDHQGSWQGKDYLSKAGFSSQGQWKATVSVRVL